MILTRQTTSGSLELLEGLTSNLFVLYKDGTLRTPSTSLVLGGCAREMVLNKATLAGIAVAVDSIDTMDADQWDEVFLTSSIRLIVPVSELILAHKLQNGTTTQEILWSSSKTEVAERLFHLLHSDPERVNNY